MLKATQMSLSNTPNITWIGFNCFKNSDSRLKHLNTTIKEMGVLKKESIEITIKLSC